MVTNLQKGLVLPDPGEVPSLSGKTLWKYQREARCHINTVMISPEFLPRAGVTRKQRKWWHILTQDPGKSNPDILFRARDSSSANYRGKRRACFSQRRLRLHCQNSLDSGARGPGAQRNYLYMNSSRFGSNTLDLWPRMKTKEKRASGEYGGHQSSFWSVWFLITISILN